MKLSVRAATTSDLSALIQLGRLTFIETYKGMGQRPPGLEELYGKELFNETVLIPQLAHTGPFGPIYLMGFADSAAAGFALLEFDDPPECVPLKSSAHFSQAYVLKKYQGLGIGRRLFDQCRSLAAENGYEGLWLGVWDMNLAAIEFHKKMGFQVVGSAPWRFIHEKISYEDTDLIMYRNVEPHEDM